jgi:N-acetylglucosamine kinase-like BadF-type ATPase
MAGALFAGVDGGGSKTDYLLIDGSGQLLAAHAGPASYHLEIGLDGLRTVLREGLAALFAQARIGGEAIAHAFFGLPGYGEDSAVEPALDDLPEPLLGHRRYRCGNDMVCGWAGSLGGGDGINIVAGTGSIGYGERRGASARAGGWGEVFSDEGSAYWIAARGLNAFTRMSDGRLPKGPLHALLRTSLDLSIDLDLCARILAGMSRAGVARLARLIERAANDGDAEAIRIFDAAARELAEIVGAVRRSLGFAPAELVPVSYSGGVFKAGGLILGPLQRHLDAQFPGYRLQAPLLPPAAGAAIYAARLAAQPLSPAAMQRLAASLRERRS